MPLDNVIRLCEWGRIPTPQLSIRQRQEIMAVSQEWRREHRMTHPPLSFKGTAGEILTARQFVGVVEVAGATIEIYPKLDKRLLDSDTVADTESRPVLRNLLWMLAQSGYEEIADAGDGSLEDKQESFSDLFALLLARRLREELATGVPRRYKRFEDDLKAIRGRLLIGQQATRNLDRYDRIACAFDEFTPDTPFCRILRCACRELRVRTGNPEAFRLLNDCLTLLEDVSDITPTQALREADALTGWDRNALRFRRTFSLAVRLLRGLSHDMISGVSDTFVFLLDMNRVFESFAAAALRRKFRVPVEEQKVLGYLFPTLPKGRIEQKPDFFWQLTSEEVWIGDAKYKHLTKNQTGALTFTADDGDYDAPAGRHLSPDDVRQLTVYAELHRKKQSSSPNLALLYPFVGDGPFFADHAIAWNGSSLYLLPVRVDNNTSLQNVLPDSIYSSEKKSESTLFTS
jgi:5-methylcytosine-specific restriction enzyme subunit McrC